MRILRGFSPQDIGNFTYENLICSILLRLRSDIEALIIKSILDDAGIPCLIRERGAGSSVKIITGDSCFGTDILVNEEILEVAAELITPVDDDDVEALEALDGEDEE